jgi:hypothetical protein
MTVSNSPLPRLSANLSTWFTRIRRNHGLEHATLHILAKRFPGKNIAQLLYAH